MTLTLVRVEISQKYGQGGTVQTLPKGRRHVGFNGKSYYCDNFPVDYVLTYPINNFKIYISDKEFFTSNLQPLNMTTKNNVSWSLKEPYYQSLVGTWIATYPSGDIHRAFDIQTGCSEANNFFNEIPFILHSQKNELILE